MDIFGSKHLICGQCYEKIIKVCDVIQYSDIHKNMYAGVYDPEKCSFCEKVGCLMFMYSIEIKSSQKENIELKSHNAKLKDRLVAIEKLNSTLDVCVRHYETGMTKT